MATITATINENGTPVGSGWKLVYGDSGTGVRTTNGSGVITWASVPASFEAVLAYNVIDDAGTSRVGGAGLYIAAGGSYEFNV